MRRNLILTLSLGAILAAPVSAQVPPRFEIGLQCAAGATVSAMLLRDHNAPQDMQEPNAKLLQSTTTLLHDTASVANMTIEDVDREVIRRASLLVDKLNAVPDEAYEATVFIHISFEADGGMAACTALADAARADGIVQ